MESITIKQIEDITSCVHNFCSEQMAIVKGIIETNLLKIKNENNSQISFLPTRRKKITKFLTDSGIQPCIFVSEMNGIEKIELSITSKGNMAPFLDRLVHFAVPNVLYGFLPSTISSDNDAVDVFVLFPTFYDIKLIHPGSHIDIIPILKINLIDNGEQDDKIIALPVPFLSHFFETKKEQIITHYILNILFFLQTQNLIDKVLKITSFDGFEETKKFIADCYYSFNNNT